jgi:hypothetical protein
LVWIFQFFCIEVLVSFAEIAGTQEQVTVAKSLITIAMELMDDKGGDRDRYRFPKSQTTSEST